MDWFWCRGCRGQDPDNLDRAFGRHLQLAGLPEFSLHDLRHTHASLAIAAGMNPKELQVRMGHASIQVTMDRYGHLFRTAYRGTGERLDALLKANSRQTTPRNEERGSDLIAETRVTVGLPLG